MKRQEQKRQIYSRFPNIEKHENTTLLEKPAGSGISKIASRFQNIGNHAGPDLLKNTASSYHISINPRIRYSRSWPGGTSSG